MGIKYRLGDKEGAWWPKTPTKLWLTDPMLPGRWQVHIHEGVRQIIIAKLRCPEDRTRPLF